MRTIYKSLLIAFITSFSFLVKVNGQNAGSIPYGEGSTEHWQIKRLVDRHITYAERMLVKQGAYAPYAAALTVKDSMIAVELPAGYQDKELKRVLDEIKAHLKIGADKGLYKAVAMFYDVTITDPVNNQQTDAIAVFTEQVNTIGSYTYYYPYKKTEEKKLTHGKTFGGLSENEIFTKVSRH